MIKNIIIFIIILFSLSTGIIVYNHEKAIVEIDNIKDKLNVVYTCSQVLCKPNNLTIVCESNISKYQVVNFC